MTGLDTSVVVRLLVKSPKVQAVKARRFLDTIFEKGERATVSDLVICETYFALQYHYGVPKAEALEALRLFVESPEIRASGVAAEILRQPDLASAKPGFVDRVIHGGYHRRNEGMATFERKASKLENVTIL